MAQGNIIKGGKLMLFLNGASIGAATSHSLNINSNTTEISTKDTGIYGEIEATNVTWEITSENLFIAGEFDKLFAAQTGLTKVTCVFGQAAQWDGKSLTSKSLENWTNDTTTPYYTGSGYITSLSVNAPNSENATYSVTITGSGEITKVSA